VNSAAAVPVFAGEVLVVTVTLGREGW